MYIRHELTYAWSGINHNNVLCNSLSHKTSQHDGQQNCKTVASPSLVLYAFFLHCCSQALICSYDAMCVYGMFVIVVLVVFAAFFIICLLFHLHSSAPTLTLTHSHTHTHFVCAPFVSVVCFKGVSINSRTLCELLYHHNNQARKLFMCVGCVCVRQ